MKLNDLDALQHFLTTKEPRHDGGCYDCIHSELESDGFHCQHPLNKEINDLRVFFGIPSIVYLYLEGIILNPLIDIQAYIGSYCKEYEYFDYEDEEDEELEDEELEDEEDEDEEDEEDEYLIHEKINRLYEMQNDLITSKIKNFGIIDSIKD